jgi:hypothetical protein
MENQEEEDILYIEHTYAKTAQPPEKGGDELGLCSALRLSPLPILSHLLPHLSEFSLLHSHVLACVATKFILAHKGSFQTAKFPGL